MYRGKSNIFTFIIYNIHGCIIVVPSQSSVHSFTAKNIVVIVEYVHVYTFISLYCYCVVFDNNPILDFKSINI